MICVIILAGMALHRSGGTRVCTFENALYENPSADIKTAEIKHGYGTPQAYFNMEDTSTSNVTKGRKATVLNFQNPVFPQMSAQKNMSLYS